MDEPGHGGYFKRERPPEETAPDAKRRRTGRGLEGGGAAATISGMVAEVVQIKEERMEEAMHRQAEDADAIRLKAQEVAVCSPSPTIYLNVLVP